MKNQKYQSHRDLIAANRGDALRVSGDVRWLTVAVAVSLAAHILFFAALVLAQIQPAQQRRSAAMINVRLVSVPAAPSTRVEATNRAVDKQPKSSKKAATQKKERVKLTPKTKPAEAPAAKSIKEKVSLKKKTYQAAKVKQSTLKDIEKKVETSASEKIASAIERLKKEIEAEPAAADTEDEPQASGTSFASTGAAGAATDGRVGDLIDVYRVEIAYQIQRHWAFPEQLAKGRNQLQTLLVFKVMPDGEIRDLFFTDRSGNTHFDESAYRAVMKSNPVDPHPVGITRPYVQMGLRFTPEGIQ